MADVDVKEVGLIDTPDAIKEKRTQLLGKFDDFKDAAKARRQLLEDAKEFHIFKRDADELKAWLQEKIDSLKEEVLDASNVEGKSEKVEALEAEKAAALKTLDELYAKGNDMVNRDHYAKEQIQKILDELQHLYDQLNLKLVDRKDKIVNAKSLTEYFRLCDEAQMWIVDKKQLIRNLIDDVSANIDHVQLCERKYEDFTSKDKMAFEPKMAEVTEKADELTKHPEYERVKERHEEVYSHWEELKVICDEAEERIFGAKEIQKFFKDASDMTEFLNEKRAQVSIDDYGRDLPSVQALQRRHENLERDLTALNENSYTYKVKNICERADTLAGKYGDYSDEILEKKMSINDIWAKLQAEATDRKNKLNAAHDMFLFLGEHTDLMQWIKEKTTLLKSDELATDVPGAEQLINRHNEHKAELLAEEDSFTRCEDLGNKLIEAEHPNSDSIKDKLAELAREKAALFALWDERKLIYSQCIEYQIFCRDVEQTEAWLAKQEAFLDNDDLGDSVDGVEALLKKHEDFEKSLSAQEEKVNTLSDFANQLIDTQPPHYATDDITKRRDALVNRRKTLHEKMQSRRTLLELSFRYQQFERDAYEIKTWINERFKTVRDESAYRDPTNLQGKLQKHHAFTSEIESNKARIDGVLATGQQMINEDHFQSDEIHDRNQELKSEFGQLEDETRQKEVLIVAAIDAQAYYRGVEDLELWMSEIEAHLASDDYGKDLASCHNLIKKHQLLEVDVQQHRDRVEGVYRQCKKFTEAKHFDTPNIKHKQEEVQRRYVDLRDPMKKRKAKLEDAMRLHQLFRDIEDEESWIREKEPVAQSQARGKDLIGAQKLLKKHHALIAEIDAHEDSLNKVVQTAKDMMGEEHFAAEEIQNKIDDVTAMWDKLKERSNARLDDLQDALEAQEYLLDANEASAWMNEKLPLVAPTGKYGKNQDAINSAVKKHQNLMKDIDSYKKVIDNLAQKAQECKAPDKEVTDVVDLECATVVYDYLEKNPRELSVKKGETVTILSTPTRDWYKVENQEGKQGFVPANHLKRAEPVVKSSQERLAEEARTVSDRQKQIENQYGDLKGAAEKKERALKLRTELYGLKGESKNLLMWTSKKNHNKLLDQVDNVLTAEDEDLDKIDELSSKFNNLQNDVENSKKKLDENKNKYEELKAQLDDDEEVPEDLLTEDMEHAVEAVSYLQNKVFDKSSQLGSAHEVKNYIRESDLVLERISEKDKAIKEGYYGNDLPSVQALSRKHEAFQKDLVPLEESVKNLDDRHTKLIDTHPDQTDEIQEKQKEVNEAWEALKNKSDKHAAGLLEAYEYQKYLAQYRDTMAWINGMKQLAGSDELGKDVNSCEALIERHDDLKNELEAKVPQFDAFYNLADDLVNDKHPESEEIKRMKDEVKKALADLDEVYEERQTKLEANKQHQQFLRDFNQNSAWMNNREKTLGQDDDDVDSVMKKHEDFDKLINNQEEKIAALTKFAEELGPDHYASPDIEAKKEDMIKRWEHLKEALVQKRSQLGESQTIQELVRDADDIESYIQEKMVVANQDDSNDGRNIPSKHQKQLAFEAELAANAERIQATLSVGKALLDSKKVQGEEEKEIAAKLAKITEQYEFLVQKTTQKTARLKEANRQRLYYTAYKDFDFWLSEVESQLKMEEKSNDLSTVQNQRKKHQLLEDDVAAHADRLVQLNELAEECMASPQFDPVEIEQKRSNINDRFGVVSDMTKDRRKQLDDAFKYHQLLRDISEEETWIREKKILVQSQDYGKDLTGVHNLMKKHKRIENEIQSHEKRIEAVKPIADEIVKEQTTGWETVPGRIEQLDQAWSELLECSKQRVDMLNESQRFYEFIRDVEEEESWISEKQSLMSSNDFGDTLASVQGLIKKHTAFDMDVVSHTDKANLLEVRGNQLIEEKNLQSDKVAEKLQHLKDMLEELRRLAGIRRENLKENSALLQFTWKADVVESWVNEKQSLVQSNAGGDVEEAKDLSAVQDMLHRQETFEAGLTAFQAEGIVPIGKLRDTLVNAGHISKNEIDQRYKSLLDRWHELQKRSNDRRDLLDKKLRHFQAVEDKFLLFAKKASSFNSWFENAEEDLSDPVKCNSIDEIKALEHAHNVFVDSLKQAEEDLESLRVLDAEIKAGGATVNPYTWFTMQALDETWDNLKKIVSKRELELKEEHRKQVHNDELRQKFAREANAFHDWLTDTRVKVMEETGSLEQQLESLKKITLEVKSWRNKLKSIETIGNEMGMHIILDNRYTEHSTVGLHQQWDQLEQLCQRMQQNLEQQIQAKETSGVSETQLRDFSLMFRHHDKERTGRLNHADFKKCLRSLGYDLPMFEEGQIDNEFEAILDIVDRNRDGFVTLQEYMQFMISRETENVQSKGDIEEAFRTLSPDGNMYITQIEITQALDKETADFCIANMKAYIDMNNIEMPGTYDYVEFCNRLFQK
ncbi:spectrin alpha chain-like isoform X2 [Symsagittifera roscoffensis]|uniref:spectrin alpha chain-like isoform X2 n=1 Tax=Symsagittifera roscoffensis TaxID=84072 RepID=UPI00307B1B1C